MGDVTIDFADELADAAERTTPNGRYWPNSDTAAGKFRHSLFDHTMIILESEAWS